MFWITSLTCTPQNIIVVALVVYVAAFMSPAIAVGVALFRFRRKEGRSAKPLRLVLLARKNDPCAEDGRVLRRELGMALIVGVLLSAICGAALYHAKMVGAWLC